MGWAIARETGASVLTYELYPLGFFPREIPVLALPSRGSSRRPILFLHGVFHNPATFAWLKQKLAWAGWRRFGELNLWSSLRPIPENAHRIHDSVEALCRAHEAEEVDIVAHSMGGILARYYVQLLGGHARVRHLITLATPHQGTRLSRFSLFPQLRELSPGSETLARLNLRPLPERTLGVSVSGELDVLMQPRGCDHWPGARNFRLAGVGHAGLLFSKRVAQILISHLGAVEND